MAEYPGLCASCKNAAKCEYLKIAPKPVLQCAEFQGFESRRLKIELIKSFPAIPEIN